MSEIIALVFTEKYLAAGIVQNRDNVQWLRVEDHKFIPLFFEVKDENRVVLVDEATFELADTPNFIGHFFDAISSNKTFMLGGSGQPVENLLLDVVSGIKAKYWAALGRSPVGRIPLALCLPDDVSEKAKDHVRDLLGRQGFDLIREESVAAALLAQDGISSVMLEALGGSSLQIVVKHGTVLEREKLFDFDNLTAKVALGKLVVNKALRNSFSSLLRDEDAARNEYRNHLGQADAWIATLQKEGTLNTYINFSDGESGNALVRIEEFNNLLFDAGGVFARTRYNVEQFAQGAGISRAWIVGSKLANEALQSLLTQQFGRDKMVILTEEEAAVRQVMIGLLDRAATDYGNRPRPIQESRPVKEPEPVFVREPEPVIVPEPEPVFVREPEPEPVFVPEPVVIREPEPVKKNIPPVEQDFAKVNVLMGVESNSLLQEVSTTEYQKAVRKILKEESSNDRFAKDNFVAEIKRLAYIANPGIAKVYKVDVDARLPYFLAEYAEGKKLKTVAPLANAEDTKKSILGILKAVEYLHSRDFWYKTLKSENIIVNKDKMLLVASGLEYVVGQDAKSGLPNKIRINIKDLGSILLEMLTGKTTVQALNEIKDKRWAEVIKRSSPGSSADTYKTISEMIIDIEKRFAPGPPTPAPTPFPLVKVLVVAGIALAVVAMAMLGYVYRDNIIKMFAKTESQVEPKPNPPTDSKVDLGRLPGRYKGSYQNANNENMEVWLDIATVDLQAAPSTFKYNLRIETTAKVIQFRSFGQTGTIDPANLKVSITSETLREFELIAKGGQFKFQSKDFPSLILE